MTWRKYRRYLARLLRHFRLCTLVSEVERELLSAAVPSYRAAYVIPNSIDVSQYQRRDSDWADSSLVFAGSLCYEPNYDAMQWFLREIYPSIQSSVPAVTLRITGDTGGRTLPSDSSVRLTGRLSDVRSTVARSAVSLAPIRTGGGTRVKILEAMALGSPVVATSKAVEGLEVQDGKHLLIRDNPQQFAAAVIELLNDRRLARRLTDEANHLVNSLYNSNVVLPRFLALLDMAAGVRHAPVPVLPVRMSDGRGHS
jgi:polysaccharide biosynthesis protein PslH